MTPKSQFQELDPTIVFEWIAQIRSCRVSELERTVAETRLYQCLIPVSTWFAHLRTSPPGYDLDQVLNDSIYQFMLVYVRNQDFAFHSCGHLVSILSKITTNQRRMSYRRNSMAKRAPHDPDGHSLTIESLDILACTCKANSADPASTCEQRDELQHYAQLLSDVNHRQVFRLLVADFTWSEIGTKLEVDAKTVRLWISQMRRILTPHTNNQQPTTNNQLPTALNPIISLGIDDQAYHSNSVFQRGGYIEVGVR